ncbi:MAG: adenine phosphoribosyltransferase [Cyclobacteriaceae bacterium]|jgi:adenine phosphoribosyltransferase
MEPSLALQERIKQTIRDIPDFPKPGILFKDITTLMLDYELSEKIIDALAYYWRTQKIGAVTGIESRGFIYGMPLAQRLKVPFIPIRKAGKLPYDTISYAYDLEYGSAEIEMHKDALAKNQRVLIHDDLLATGGTAAAAGSLVETAGAQIAGFSFIVGLSFLKGESSLRTFTEEIHSLVTY